MKWNSSPGPTSMVACPGLRSASRCPVIRDDCIPPPDVADVQAHRRWWGVQANDGKALTVTPDRPPAPITDLPLLILCAGFRNWPFLNRIFDLQEERNFNSDGSLTAEKNRSEMPVQYTLKVPSVRARRQAGCTQPRCVSRRLIEFVAVTHSVPRPEKPEQHRPMTTPWVSAVPYPK